MPILVSIFGSKLNVSFQERATVLDALPTANRPWALYTPLKFRPTGYRHALVRVPKVAERNETTDAFFASHLDREQVFFCIPVGEKEEAELSERFLQKPKNVQSEFEMLLQKRGHVNQGELLVGEYLAKNPIPIKEDLAARFQTNYLQRPISVPEISSPFSYSPPPERKTQSLPNLAQEPGIIELLKRQSDENTVFIETIKKRDEQLAKNQKEMDQKNLDIEKQNEAIVKQNEAIVKQNEAIVKQNEAIVKQNEMIEKKNAEIEELFADRKLMKQKMAGISVYVAVEIYFRDTLNLKETILQERNATFGRCLAERRDEFAAEMNEKQSILTLADLDELKTFLWPQRRRFAHSLPEANDLQEAINIAKLSDICTRHLEDVAEQLYNN